LSGHYSSRSLLASFCSPAAGSCLEVTHQCVDGFTPSTELLIVGETRDAADDVAREIVTRRWALFGLHRFSLRQLASALAATDFRRLSVSRQPADCLV